MPKQSFEDKYPNIARWIYRHRGRIEIGYDSEGMLSSFIRAIDMGGMLWEGKDDYQSLDDAFLELESGVQDCLRKSTESKALIRI